MRVRLGLVVCLGSCCVACLLTAPARDEYVGPAGPAGSDAGPSSVETGAAEDAGAAEEASADGPSGACPRPSAANLLSNPSFENDLSGWIKYQATLGVKELPTAPLGSWVAVVSAAGGDAYTIDDGPDTVESTVAGRTYVATAQVAAATTQSIGRPIVIILRQRPTMTSSATKEWFSTRTALAEEFQTICVRGEATVTGETLDLRVAQLDAVPGDAFYIDDAAFQELP